MWHADGAPFEAALHFRVGRADEPFPRAGITSLIVTLVADVIGEPVEAIVTPNYCVFLPDGPGQLARIGRALAEPRVDRVEDARRSLADKDMWAWMQSHFPTVRARLLTARYGVTGYGLGDDDEYGLRWVGADEVRAWWTAHFTRGNAGLFVLGEPPADLGFELPDGPRVAPPEPAPLPAALPAFARHELDTAVLSGVVPHTAAAAAARAIAQGRLGGGASSDLLMLRAGVGHLLLEADDVDALWRTANELAEGGPTAGELARHGRPWTDPRMELGLRVMHELAGSTYERAPVDGEAVRGVMRALLEQALLLGSRAPAGVPDYELPPELDPEGERFQRPKPGRLRRRPDEELWVGAHGVGRREGAATLTIAWDALVAGEERPLGRLRLLAADGASLDLVPGDWERGAQALDRVRERLGPERLFPACEPAQLVAIDAAVARRALDGVPVDRLPHALRPVEALLDVVRADRGDEAGLLALTDGRLIWLDAGEMEQIHIDRSDCAAVAQGDQLSLTWPYGTLRLTIAPPATATELARLI